MDPSKIPGSAISTHKRGESRSSSEFDEDTIFASSKEDYSSFRFSNKEIEIKLRAAKNSVRDRGYNLRASASTGDAIVVNIMLYTTMWLYCVVS